MKEIVDRLVTAHREMDAKVQEMRKIALDLEAGYFEAAGKATGVGALDIKLMIEETRALTGRVADVGVDSAKLHIKGHKIANMLGYETPPLVSVGGQILMGGGDR